MAARVRKTSKKSVSSEWSETKKSKPKVGQRVLGYWNSDHSKPKIVRFDGKIWIDDEDRPYWPPYLWTELPFPNIILKITAET